jgi:hypothetical protein
MSLFFLPQSLVVLDFPSQSPVILENVNVLLVLLCFIVFRFDVFSLFPSDSPTMAASSSKKPRSDQPRIKPINPPRGLASTSLPEPVTTRSKGKARELGREASPSPPPVPTGKGKNKAQSPAPPPVASSSRSTLRPLVRQRLVPMLSHIYSHGLNIPTMPYDPPFGFPSTFGPLSDPDLRQVQASYSLTDSLPGAIRAGDLSQLGPIPQVRIVWLFFIGLVNILVCLSLLRFVPRAP